jgi:hypothetical protein
MATVPAFQPEVVDEQPLRTPKSREELREILRAAQDWYQATFGDRDLAAELIAERRIEAANE